MAYKFQIGAAQLSGNLTQEGTVVGESTISGSSTLSGFDLVIQDGKTIGVNGDTNLMTLAANSVDVEGDVSASLGFDGLDLQIEDGKTIGSRSDTSLITLDNNAITLGANNTDVSTFSSQATASAGFTVNGSGHTGLIVGASGEFQVTVADGAISTSGDVSGSAFFINAGSDAEIAQNWLPDVDNSLNLGDATKSWANIYVENVVGAVINVETRTYTSTATIGSSVGFAIANSATAFQLDLPAGADGKVVRIKSINNGAITLSASVAGETMADETNGDLLVLEAKGAAVTCVFSGSAGAGDWYII